MLVCTYIYIYCVYVHISYMYTHTNLVEDFSHEGCVTCACALASLPRTLQVGFRCAGSVV